MNEKQPPQMQIEIPENISQGVYANFAIISHSETEFVFDFVFAHPSQPKSKVLSRVITSPAHAKRFLKALQENIGRYEQNIGKIADLPDQPRGFGVQLSNN